MPGRANRNAIIFAGTMGLIRRSALEGIGGWEESVITEDAEASLRMLGLGSVGVFEPTVWGEGLMPLSFDGLKKQRFRWALGGIQILRRQWRELLPFTRHRLHLTWGQRLHYLFGSVHWFGDLLTVGFTLLLLLTAVAATIHHRLPVRELTGPILIVPLAFLVTGVLRGLWALRRAERCSWGDALHALGIWFALSWVVTLAVVRGLLSREAAFLRTPKQKATGNRLWPAVRSSAVESTLALLALVGAIVMLLAAPAVLAEPVPEPDPVAERVVQPLGLVQLGEQRQPVEIVKVVPLEHHALDAKGRPGAELRGRLIRCPDDPATPPQLLRRGCRGHVRKRTQERLHPAALFGNLVRIAAD